MQPAPRSITYTFRGDRSQFSNTGSKASRFNPHIDSGCFYCKQMKRQVRPAVQGTGSIFQCFPERNCFVMFSSQLGRGGDPFLQ